MKKSAQKTRESIQGRDRRSRTIAVRPEKKNTGKLKSYQIFTYLVRNTHFQWISRFDGRSRPSPERYLDVSEVLQHSDDCVLAS